MVKGDSVFPLLKNLNIVQAEPSPARREVQEDHGRHRALPCSLWKEFKKRQTQIYVGSQSSEAEELTWDSGLSPALSQP